MEILHNYTFIQNLSIRVKDRLVNCLSNSYNCLYTVATDRENTINRLFYASVPYLYSYPLFSKYYTLIDQAFSIKSKAKSTYRDIGFLVKKYREEGLTKDLVIKSAKLVAGISYFVFCFMNPRWGWIISNGMRSASSLKKSVTHFKNKEYKEGFDKLYRSIAHGIISASSIQRQNLVLRILSETVQIISTAERSYKEYCKQRYIETVSNLGLVFRGSYHMLPNLKMFYNRSFA